MAEVIEAQTSAFADTLAKIKTVIASHMFDHESDAFFGCDASVADESICTKSILFTHILYSNVALRSHR